MEDEGRTKDIDSDLRRERAHLGRFRKGITPKGAKPFQKGNPGMPKGIKHKKTLLAQEWARDILHTDPETGKKLTTSQVRLMLAREARKSPRILNLLLDHYWGKPTEHVQQEQKIFILKGATSSLHPHYRNFITTTGWSVPVPRLGTLTLVRPPLEFLPSHRDDRFPRSTQEPSSGSRHLYAGETPPKQYAVPPGLILELSKPPVLTSSITFRHLISSSLALVSLNLTCHDPLS